MTTNIPCPFCHTDNSVTAPDAANARCGHCGHKIFFGKAQRMNAQDFGKHLDKSDIPILADFGADWCSPCRAMEPILDQVAKALEPDVRIIKIDTDHEQRLAGQHVIRGLPTFVIFKDGTETARRAGAAPMREFLDWVRENL